MRLPAGARIIVSTAVVVLLVVVLGVTASLITAELGQQLHRAIKQEARQQMLAGRIAAGVSDLHSAERGLALSAMLQHTASSEQLRGQFSSTEEELRRTLAELEQTGGARGIADGGRSVLDEERQLILRFEEARHLHAEVLQNLDQQKMDAALVLLNTSVLPKLAAMGQIARRIVDRKDQELSATSAKADDIRRVSLLVITGLSILSVMVGGAVLFNVRRIYFVLRQTVDELNEDARDLARAAASVSSSSQSVAQAASEQAASLEETSASAEQLHEMTRRNAGGAESATMRTQHSFLTIQETNLALEQMVLSMNEINVSSNKISKIIKVIDDIAFQTNILALNAAVEAARAGEAGMGFAVVAEEVRSLAQRSAQAARDTTELIEESIQRANEGKSKLDEVARGVAMVTDSAEKARSLVEEVHVASGQQSRGIEQIAQAVGHMERLTQQLAVTAEESAANGQQLSGQARRVDEIVFRLQQLVGGSSERTLAAAMNSLRYPAVRPPGTERNRGAFTRPDAVPPEEPAKADLHGCA